MAKVVESPMCHSLKILSVFIFTFFTVCVQSQTKWNEEFSDSNFTSNPIWLGDTAEFIVNALKQLQLEAPSVTSSSFLQTSSTAAINSTWTFWLKLDFNPSTNNFAQVFIMSSIANPNQALQGYYVQVGGSSSDQVSLFKRTGNQNSLLIQSNSGIVNQNQVDIRIKVERDSSYNWKLWADSTGGNNFNLLGSKVDSEITASNHFLFNCIYTSTRSNKFFLDQIDVDGNEYLDTIPPRITSFEFPNRNSLSLLFSEALDSASARSSFNYQYLESNNSIQNINWYSNSPKEVLILFNNDFDNGQALELSIKNIYDLYGNKLVDTNLTVPFFKPVYKSVVINEIMADPSPPVGLPDGEYIELHNTDSGDINLEGWKLVLDLDTFQIGNYNLETSGFVLLISSLNEIDFSSIPHIPIHSASGWLKNGGEQIVLLNELDEVIDAQFYTTGYYRNDAKNDGGWSLELIESYLKCSESLNWSASDFALGGTPGFANVPEQSFEPSNTSFHYAVWKNARSIDLVFDRGLDPNHLPEISSDFTIEDIFFTPIKPQRVSVKFYNNITSNVTLTIADSLSCQGDFVSDTITFSEPQEAESGDLVLNEILFNPKTDGSDFIEVWNTSAKTLRLDQLRLVDFDENNDIKNQYSITNEKIILSPKSIISFSENHFGVCSDYSCAQQKKYLNVSPMPSMPDNEGQVGIASSSLQILESVSYSNNWHHQLISNEDGVSLERIHPSLPIEKSSSWHSAASSVNYASPGKMNSQFSPAATNQNNIWLNNSTMSPNNDGSNDILIVYYDLPTGSALSVRVLAMNGTLIHTIADNILTDTSGQLTWDGKSNKGQTASTGVYIVLSEWFTPDGNKGLSKINLAVSR